MKQSADQVLSTLKIAATTTSKLFAGKISSMLSIVNQLEKMDLFRVSLSGIKGNYELVKLMPVLNKDNYTAVSQVMLGTTNNLDREKYEAACLLQRNTKEIYGEVEHWDTITVSSKTSSYQFPFPTGNKYYDIFRTMAGLKPQKETAPAIIPLQVITVDSGCLKNLALAAKFVSADDLRPALMHVCVVFDNQQMQIIATNAHYMFYSKKIESNESKRTEILISKKTALLISKIKPTSGTIEIKVLPDNNIMVEGETFETGKLIRYPDYSAIIPSYKGFMEFDKVVLENNIKQVLPSANKVTKMVNVHLNGQIKLYCCDIDYCIESAATMPYISKDFKDTNAGFNGTMLMTTLNSFKDKTLKMYTDGTASKAFLFTNDVNTVLLMPLMLHN